MAREVPPHRFGRQDNGQGLTNAAAARAGDGPERGTLAVGQGPGGPPPGRSVTVNLAESPLGCLFARGFVTRNQYDAGAQLRLDWERAELAPNVTMSWDAAPIARGRGGASPRPEPSAGQLDARRRFDAAVASAGPGLADILWRWSAPGRECATPRRRSAGPPAPASWC